MPFDDLEAREGRTIAGVLGVDLFRNYVVILDYDHKKLSLFAPKSFVYSASGVVVPLRQKGAALFQATIRLRDGQSIPAQLAVDLGTYSALRLYPRFVQQHNLLTDPRIPSLSSFGFGIGGEFPETQARIGDLQISSLHIQMPVASVSQASHGATATSNYDGTIGGAILRRFTVTLDYSRSQMILEPNSNFESPFEADTSGLVLSASGPDFKTISAHHVISNTPAAAEGIHEGDGILQVNGVPTGTLGLEELRVMFCVPVYHLQVQRGPRIIAVNLTTHELIP